MSKAQARESLIALLEQESEKHGFELVTIDMTGTAKNPLLRVYLDKQGGITLDEIAQAQQEWLEAVIDEADPYNGSYTLEVSSPGIDRPLRKLSDFERFAQEEIKFTVETSEGPRKKSGILKGVVEGKVAVETVDDSQNTQEELFDFESIKKATIIGKVDFSKGKVEE